MRAKRKMRVKMSMADDGTMSVRMREEDEKGRTRSLTVPRKARMIWVYRCLDLPDRVLSGLDFPTSGLYRILQRGPRARG